MRNKNLLIPIFLLILFSNCSTLRKTIKESTTTETQTIYQDTTVSIHLPQEAPQNRTQELFTNPEWKCHDSIFNTDTLTIETTTLTAKAFVSKHKLHLLTIPKDTAIQLKLKNAVRITQSRVHQQKTIEKQKNRPVILWVLILLAVVLWAGYSGKSK